MPLVTVVIPVYNRAHSVRETVKSVQQQTVTDWELLAVDDGSKDNSLEVLETLAKEDARIRVIRQENGGAQKARNRGLREAKGEWLAFLDSDDAWPKTSLEMRLSVAQRDAVSVVHGQGDIIHPDGRQVSYQVPAFAGDVYKDLLRSEGPVIDAIMVKKEAMAAIGYLDESIAAFQEWDLVLRLAKKGYRFGFVPETTFIYDCRGTDTISKNYRRAGVGYEQILKKFEKDMFWFTGPYTVIRHYEAAATDWYARGGDDVSAERCKRKARFYRMFHFRSIKEKLFK